LPAVDIRRSARHESESSNLVSFVSLFLGLVVGSQTVVLDVAEPVARVEILLDGYQAAAGGEFSWFWETRRRTAVTHLPIRCGNISRA